MKKFLYIVRDWILSIERLQPLLRYVDRYTRKGRHRDRPGSVSGYAMRAWLKQRLDVWYETYRCHGINAAIDLGL